MEENKKIIKNCYFRISKISPRQVTGFEKDKILNIKKVGLVAAQCNGIAACAYSLQPHCVGSIMQVPYSTLNDL